MQIRSILTHSAVMHIMNITDRKCYIQEKDSVFKRGPSFITFHEVS